jgi:hypothetical protein
VRYFVRGDVEVAKPGIEVSGDADGKVEIREEDRLAIMSFVFAVDYRCTAEQPPDADALSAFAQNAAFHAWPYWRESVHAVCARMRLPTMTVPMFRRGEIARGGAAEPHQANKEAASATQ